MNGTSGPKRTERQHDLADDLGEVIGDPEQARRAVADLRADLIAPLDPEVTERHLSAMLAAAAERTTAPGVVDLRRRKVRRAAVGTAVTMLALGTTGGLAAAGSLPPVLQDPLSRVAGVVSIDLPRSTPPTTVEIPQTPGTTGDRPSDTAPGQTVETPGDRPGDTAPGQPSETPGNTAPGQTGETPGDTAPGQTGDRPGDTAPGGPGGSGGPDRPGRPN
jgi:hypothetical protein